ncbi:GGDEF domain-containing protein [Vibrio harveyi]|nr:GGDEF domain-containing protein [Vibrio harveyi]
MVLKYQGVNDQYGHAVGDQLLKVVAQRLMNCVARRDLVSRLAGDEFLIAVRDASSSEPIARRIIESLEKPFLLGDVTCEVSASIGISYWSREDSATLDEKINEADVAMYLAKKRGKTGTTAALKRFVYLIDGKPCPWAWFLYYAIC